MSIIKGARRFMKLLGKINWLLLCCAFVWLTLVRPSYGQNESGESGGLYVSKMEEGADYLFSVSFVDTVPQRIQAVIFDTGGAEVNKNEIDTKSENPTIVKIPASYLEQNKIYTLHLTILDDSSKNLTNQSGFAFFTRYQFIATQGSKATEIAELEEPVSEAIEVSEEKTKQEQAGFGRKELLIGAAIGGVLLLIAIIASVLLLLKKKKQQPNYRGKLPSQTAVTVPDDPFIGWTPHPSSHGGNAKNVPVEDTRATHILADPIPTGKVSIIQTPQTFLNGKTVEITQFPFSIGREGADFNITGDGHISRTHLILTFEDGIFFAIDQSSNGVYVDGKKILPQRPFPLSSGSVVKLSLGGQTHLDFYGTIN